MLVIWCSTVAGALGLTVVAAIFGPGIWSRARNGDSLAWVVFGGALACSLASKVLPSRIAPMPGATVETIAVARSLVATAFNGSMALLAPLAWMVSGKMVALVALAISLVCLVLVFPSERRWQKLCRTIGVTFGQELAAGATLSTPPPAPSRKVIALLGLLVLGPAALLVLIGNIFWTEEALRRPSSPLSRAFLLLILALMLAGFAVVRFLRASASKRPRWQRAHGVLLLVLAGYLVFQLARMG
jgi:hypothetical protein